MKSRNELCDCGSGKKFKHCHGKLPTPTSMENYPSDDVLLELLKRADRKGLSLGESPAQRSFQNPIRALQELGQEITVVMGPGTPPTLERARQLNNNLFIPNELKQRASHIGVFLFRDMFCRLHAPIVLGEVNINFWDLVDLSNFQKGWLSDTETELSIFVDQAADIIDFGHGWSEFCGYQNPDSRSRDLIWRSHMQLEAAAATATSTCDFRGTIQSALLGTELALKAGLAARGISDEELRNPREFGHNLEAAAAKLGKLCNDFDADRVTRVVKTFPNFVKVRYTDPFPSRNETGHILMGAQYVASEVTRQFTDRNIRKDQSQLRARSYPK
ncbi:SEC-C metal-binding domain-containing protein [Roseibium litorale]|uniref:SEC-C domain-containing protein n=1 Tax=Roseibium litorale TaxID=2803841 RepID=A0ABR9CHU1_9HYPH|nr:SEC-C domain-containing protein [Roseibium litorale]MBD8890399.1 SEC-C domain-containing protein [Roseibium litorale]